MGLSPGFRDYLSDLFVAFGAVGIRMMFGGAGVFADGVMFAILIEDTLYLKADAEFARDFAAEGKAAFVYRRSNGKAVALSYWQAPERLIDDPHELAAWARRSLAIAKTANSTAKPKRARTSRAG